MFILFTSCYFSHLLRVLLLLLVALPVAAEQLSGLYDVAVPVASQSSRDLTAASRDGLRTVFVRVSGDANVVQQKSVASAIRNAGDYTRLFRYERRADSSGDSEQLWVVIEFEQLLVDQVLREAGLPLWSSNRPSVLVWMVVEDADGRRFVGVERDPDTVEAVITNAKRRGLPVRLPGLDLEDMVALSPDDLWQLRSFRAQQAAERYLSDSVLFGKLTQLTNGEWLGRWRFDFNHQQFLFDGAASNIDDYVGEALDQVAEWMAAEYAISPVKLSDNGILMRIVGIKSFIDYARAISYLEGIAAIRHANVVTIAGDEILVHISADGLLSQLQQAIALDVKLTAVAVTDYQQNYPVDLNYRWSEITDKR